MFRSRFLLVGAGVVTTAAAPSLGVWTLIGGATTAPALQGTIAYGAFHSAALRGSDHYAIYLPPGYGSSARHYPVVYFLHGLPASSSAYKGIGPIARAVEDSGREAIVVGVQGARGGDTDPDWRDWGPGRNWETATAGELVGVIDGRYRTIASRTGRLLVGISAGGYGATLIANHYPGTYAVIESWSGYFHPTDPTGTKALDLGSTEANGWATFAKQIPLLHRRFARWWNTTYYGFYVGTDDTRFRAENEQIARAFLAYHVPHVHFRIYKGGHSWSLWQEHAEAWIGGGLRFAALGR